MLLINLFIDIGDESTTWDEFKTFLYRLGSGGNENETKVFRRSQKAVFIAFLEHLAPINHKHKSTAMETSFGRTAFPYTRSIGLMIGGQTAQQIIAMASTASEQMFEKAFKVSI